MTTPSRGMDRELCLKPAAAYKRSRKKFFEAQASYVADSGNDKAAVAAVTAFRKAVIDFSITEAKDVPWLADVHPLVIVAALRSLCALSTARYAFPVALPYAELAAEEVASRTALGFDYSLKHDSETLAMVVLLCTDVNRPGFASVMLSGGGLDALVYLLVFPPPALTAEATLPTTVIFWLRCLIEHRRARKILLDMWELPALEGEAYAFPYECFMEQVPEECRILQPGKLPQMLCDVLAVLTLTGSDLGRSALAITLLQSFFQAPSPIARGYTVAQFVSGHWLPSMIAFLQGLSPPHAGARDYESFWGLNRMFLSIVVHEDKGTGPLPLSLQQRLLQLAVRHMALWKGLRSHMAQEADAIMLQFITAFVLGDPALQQRRLVFPADAAVIAGLPNARDGPPPAASALEIGLIVAEAVIGPDDPSLPALRDGLAVALKKYPAPRPRVVALWLQRLGCPAAALGKIRRTLAEGKYVLGDYEPAFEGSDGAAAPPAQTCSNPACPRTPEELREARFFVCAGCRRAIYCGKECQASHWKAHKRLCRKWAAAREGAGAGDRKKEKE